MIGHAKLLVPALYLENGQVPIRYILACRRLLYLQTILQREPDELVHKVYLAQKANSTQGDFCQFVEYDRQLLNCCLTDEQISKTSKYDFRLLVKNKAKEQAFITLLAIKDTKTIMDNITYTNSSLFYFFQNTSKLAHLLTQAVYTPNQSGVKFSEFFSGKSRLVTLF